MGLADRFRTERHPGVHTAPDYRPDIDGLRAIAVVAVVLFHADAPVVTGGFVGVDVFFVISGFLIAGILRRELASGSFSLLGFYERRARRILPALFFVVAASLVAGWVLLLPDAFVSLGQSALAAVLFVSNYWALDSVTDYFDTGIAPLLHTWSLAVEEQFYIVFPLLLALLSRWFRAAAWWALAALCVASLVLSAVEVAGESPAAFYLAPSRAWELGIGVILALAPLPTPRPRWLAELVGLAGMAAIGGAMLFFTPETQFPGVTALLPTLGAAAIIHSGSTSRTLVHRLLALRPAVFLGLISYSLYLWHLPVLTFVKVRVTSAEFTDGPKLLAIAASFLLAVATWWLIERPFRRRSWLTRRQVFGFAGAGGLVVGALSGLVLLGSGFADRLPPAVHTILAEIVPDERRCMARAIDDLCEVGADVPPSVLVWGDSHGNSALPAFEEVLRAAGVRAVAAVRAACPPLIEIAQPWRPECEAYRAAMMQEIVAHPEWTTVVLASRWPSVVGNTLGPTPSVVLAEGVVSDPEVSAFDHGLTAAVAWLVGLGRRVVIVGTVPEPGWDVPDQMAAMIQWEKPLPPVATISGYNARNAEVFRVFATFAGERAVTVLPVGDAFCSPECVFVLDGRPLYTDDNHLTALGATEFLAPRLATYHWGD